MSFVFDYLCDVEITHILYQVFTNTGNQVAVATTFCALVSNIYGSSVWDLLHVDPLASIILRNLLHFFENLCPTVLHTYGVSAVQFYLLDCQDALAERNSERPLHVAP